MPVEKRNSIIDAALISFGTNGYKKASVSDIAKAAGISKAMVFHYFGTKKALYLYLIDLCSNIVLNEIEDKFDKRVTDFFDRIKLASNIKISIMKKHPAILTFLSSIYFEGDAEVKADIGALLKKGKIQDFSNKLVLNGMDVSKFKDGVDPKLVVKMLVWIAEGFASESPGRLELDIEALCKEFDECMNLLKENLYK